MKEQLKAIKKRVLVLVKRLTKEEKAPQTPPKQVTNTTLEKHKKEIFERARPFVKPLTPNKRKMLITTAILLAAVSAAFVVFFGVRIYVYKSDSPLVDRVSRVIPYPAARVDNRFVLYRDYLVELKPLKHFYQSPMNNQGQVVDFSTPEGQEQLRGLRDTALNEAKRKLAIRQLAREHGVRVSRAELDEEVDKFIAQTGDESKFADVVEQYYGWSVSEFRQAVYVQMLRERLQPVVSQDARERAEAILAEAEEGADFAELAEEHSEDPGSAEEGGDLGFASRGTYVPEFEEVAFELEEGEISELIATEFGFHIIKSLEKRDDDEVRVAHILISYEDLNRYVQEYLADARIKNYIDFSIGRDEGSSAPDTEDGDSGSEDE